MKIIKEKLVATRISETLYKDFRIECLNRGLSVKQAISRAIRDWMLTEPDQKNLPLTTRHLINKKARIMKEKEK